MEQMEELTLAQAIAIYAQLMDVSPTEAKEDAEHMIAQYMKKNGWSREFAEATWIEEQADADIDEILMYEKQAKANGTAKIVASGEKTKRKPRVRKENSTKRALIEMLLASISENYEASVTNPERQIDFTVEGVQYSVTLTAHRPPKEKKN